MLKPVTSVQRAQATAIQKKQKENLPEQISVTGQSVESPLSEFLSAEEMNELIPGEASETEPQESTDGAHSEGLELVTEKLEATETQVNQEELVAELMESIPELQIDEEQLDIFAPALTDDTNGGEAVDGESAMQNLVEAVVETLTETSIDTLVDTFVETEDIAKLVSSKTNVWSHVGMKLVEKTIMLLKNGMAYTDLQTPPGQLQIPSSLESASSAWTTWRQDEETGAIYLGSGSPSGETRLVGAEIDLEPLTIEDIAGTHTKVRAQSWSATQETRWSDIVFHDDGTFEYAETRVTTTGGYDTFWLESFSQSASYISANRPVTNADGSETLSSKDPNEHMFGSFELAEDGLSIELTYADGSVESRLLYKNDGYVHFGNSSFKTRQESQEQLAQIREKMEGLWDDAFVGADWISILADSAAAANENKPKLNNLFHAPTHSPQKG